MARVGDEAALLLLRCREGTQHVVEARGEPRELVGPVDRDGPQLAGGRDPLGRLGQLLGLLPGCTEHLSYLIGRALRHVGGHYEGQAVLCDEGRRTLFCGDAFKVDQDAAGNSTAVSTHKAFHKSIPLTPGELAYVRMWVRSRRDWNA